MFNVVNDVAVLIIHLTAQIIDQGLIRIVCDKLNIAFELGDGLKCRLNVLCRYMYIMTTECDGIAEAFTLNLQGAFNIVATTDFLNLMRIHKQTFDFHR